MLILGIDPSITSTGVALLDMYSDIKLVTHIGDRKLRGTERLYSNYRKFVDLIEPYDIKIAVFEDYAYGARGRGYLQHAEWVGIMKLELFKRQVEEVLVAPASLKKFVTGDGRADDSVMLLKAYKRFGWDYDNTDEIDALGLADFGRRLVLYKSGQLTWSDKLSEKQKEAIIHSLKLMAIEK